GLRQKHHDLSWCLLQQRLMPRAVLTAFSHFLDEVQDYHHDSSWCLLQQRPMPLAVLTAFSYLHPDRVTP
ncbi:MAG: hypothetical protein ONB27_10275, partial [candidate division KSB1 bacterium]|nr:hypothetical protein [candidate division KSB1 bacterium]